MHTTVSRRLLLPASHCRKPACNSWVHNPLNNPNAIPAGEGASYITPPATSALATPQRLCWYYTTLLHHVGGVGWGGILPAS